MTIIPFKECTIIKYLMLMFLLALPTLAQEPTSTEIPYITGGIGSEEREDMNAKRADYNLYITTTMKDGSYVADMPVTILDNKNQTVLTFEAQPISYVKLPVGHYTVVQMDGDKEQRRSVKVTGASKQSIQFRW
jgi:hypothetical protein